MRWIIFALAACTMLAVSSTGLLAEDDPRLEIILAHWKKLPEDLKSCRLSGQRFIYDSVFQVEKRSNFEIGWEKNGRAISRLTAIDIPKGTRSEKMSPQGKSYALKSDLEEIWYWPDQQEVIQVVFNGVETLASRYQIEPPRSEQERSFGFFNLSGWNISTWLRGPIIELPIHPALTDLADEFTWTITEEQKDHYLLKGTPPSSNSPHARNFSEIALIVQKTDLSILAMKILDPAGTTETVFRYNTRETNPVFAPDAEIFDIHEEKLKFVKPYQETQKTEPTETIDIVSPTALLGLKIAARFFVPWLPL